MQSARFRLSASASNLPIAGVRFAMLWTIFVVLMVLWVLGIATSSMLGGFIHILLVLALVTLVFRIIQGRRIAS